MVVIGSSTEKKRSSSVKEKDGYRGRGFHEKERRKKKCAALFVCLFFFKVNFKVKSKAKIIIVKKNLKIKPPPQI